MQGDRKRQDLSVSKVSLLLARCLIVSGKGRNQGSLFSISRFSAEIVQARERKRKADRLTLNDEQMWSQVLSLQDQFSLHNPMRGKDSE